MEEMNIQEGEFFRLYIHNQKRIYNYILLMVPNVMDAEDILQETAKTLWSKFSEYEKNTHFAAWAKRITHFKILSYYQSRKKNSPVLFDEAMMEKIAEYSSALMDNEDNRLFALRKCIQTLDKRDQAAVHMRYVEDRTIREIADNINRTANNVYKQFSRIHDFLLVCVRNKLSQSRL